MSIYFAPEGVKFFASAWDTFKNEPTGEIGVELARKGHLIVVAAKQQVGKDTRRLEQSIRMEHTRMGTLGQQIRIGSDNDISLIHHEGSRPHTITARNAQMLRFSRSGRVVYAHSVNHPGTKPNKYLSDNLYLVYL